MLGAIDTSIEEHPKFGPISCSLIACQRKVQLLRTNSFCITREPNFLPPKLAQRSAAAAINIVGRCYLVSEIS